jgi:hypothetical protein
MLQPIPKLVDVRRRALTISFGLCSALFLTAIFNGPNLEAQVAASSTQPKEASSHRSVNSTAQVGATETGSTDTATFNESQIVVRGDELPSAYGAPGGFSRSRFSTLTNAYVLPPGGVFAALIYEGDAFRKENRIISSPRR